MNVRTSSFDKKVVVVTGGADGLGKEIALLLKKKYTVVILGHNEINVKNTAQEVGCDYVVADVADFESLVAAKEKMMAQHGRIDCLVNNAGLWIQGELDVNDAEQLKRVMEVNATGVMLATKAILPIMKKQKRGLVIMINSQGGWYAKAERSVYTAAKWAVTGFTKSLQSEMSPYGIRVTGIYPGKMKTKMFEKLGIEKDMEDAVAPKEVAKAVAWLLELDEDIVIPEIGIKHIGN